MNKKQIIFTVVICLMSLGLWQLYRHDVSSTELLGPSSFDFTKSNNPQAESFSEESEATLKETIVRDKNTSDITQESISLKEKLASLSVEDLRRFKIVENIIETKSDNDERIDTELKGLSSSLKIVLQEKYHQLAEENRNQRGLLVYLVTRDAQTEQDLKFIKTVYEEPPCMGLADCRNPSVSDPHMDSVNQVTLDYPQKVGLYQLDKTLTEKPQLLADAKFKQAALELLQSAEKFPVPSIQRQAQKLRLKYHL